MQEPELPKNFIDVINSKETILFVGAGISTWSGAPSWKKLLEDFIDFLQYKGLCSSHDRTEIKNTIDNNDLLIAASLCKSLVNNADFSEFIYNEFVSKNFSPSKIHRLIVELGPDCYITTNYDNLIETVYQQSNNGLALRVVNNDQPIEQATIQKHSTSKFIYKVHGTMYNPSSIILTQEDYRNLRVNMISTTETLKHLLIQRSVVYFGFGLKDPTFLLIKDFIAETYSGGNRQHFAVMPDVTELQKKFWYQNYGISLISYETVEVERQDGSKYWSHEKFYDFLKSIPKTAPPTHIDAASVRQVQLSLSVLRYCDTISYEFQRRDVKVFELYGNIREVEKNTQSSSAPVKTRGKFVKITDALNSFTKLIVIGAPGSGKSTSFERYAFVLANETRDIQDSFSKKSIPVVLPFKEYNGSIMEMFVSKLPKDFDKDLALKEGLFTIMLDAINEAPKEYFENNSIKNDLTHFIESFPENKFLVSARTDSYTTYLEFPVFTIEALHYDVIYEEIKARNIEIDSLPYSFIDKLRNPFLFTLLLNSSFTKLKSIKSPANLLDKYFNDVQDKVRKVEDIGDVATMFSSVGYELVESGKITAQPEAFLRAIRRANVINEENYLNSLIALKFLIPDSEGNVGFVHQTILEYLAAKHLSHSFTANDLSTLETKLQSSRWNETLILFVTLLDKTIGNLVINKIVEKDIFFAFTTYDSATFEDETIKDYLFEHLFKRLEEPTLSATKKARLGHLFFSFTPSAKFIDKLTHYLVDNDIGDDVALALARLNHIEAIDQIITGLFERDESYPNGYARALLQFDQPEIADKVLNKIISLSDKELPELVYSNAALVIQKYTSPYIRNEIKGLALSSQLHHKRLAAQLLEGIVEDDAVEIALKLFEETDIKILRDTINALRDRTWLLNKPLIKDQRIIDFAFSKISDRELGHDFADYLSEVNDASVKKKAIEELKTSTGAIGRMNFAKIICNDEQELAFSIARQYLHNYQDTYEETLRNLIFLKTENFLSDGVELLKKRDAVTNRFILDLFSNELDELAPHIDNSTITYFFNEWEENLEKVDENNWYYWKYIIPRFIGQSRSLKNELIEKLNDVVYKHRYELLKMLIHVEVTRSQITSETIDWLLEKMTHETGELNNNATIFIGRLSDEKFARESLIPLLTSTNPTLRDNVYIAIIKIEEKTNKRLIDK